MSKFSRIATNQMTYLSLTQVMKHSSEVMQAAAAKPKVKKDNRTTSTILAEKGTNLTKLEQLQFQIKKQTLPLTIEDLKEGTMKLIGENQCTQVNEMLAQMKKQKILNI